MERSEAIEIVREYYPSSGKDLNEALKTLIPELKESEDERIRKEAISIIRQYNNICEKEGDKCEIVDRVIAWFEKQGSQNLANSEKTCKIEPKFKVGDWITNGIDVDKIIGIDLEDENYLFENGGKSDISLVESISYIWTISDAKDCDVLACDSKHGQEIGIVKKYIGKYGGCDKCFETYCFVDWDGIFRVGEYMGSQNIHPATKKQRDLLFQKMKETGYEWDAEKKEFVKIEQKPAWSEEDNINLGKAIWYVENPALMVVKDSMLVEWSKSLKDRIQPQSKQEWSEEDEKMIEFWNLYYEHKVGDMPNKDVVENLEKFRDWLKAIRERYAWKPSDEQMEALYKYVTEGEKNLTVDEGVLLQHLYNDLKELKG